MERQLFFAHRPEPQSWGELKNVPLNVHEELTVDENGNEVRGFRADVVRKVKTPLSVDNIVDAAIASEYGAEAQRRIMRNIASESDPEVEGYKRFVSEIREAALSAGYE